MSLVISNVGSSSALGEGSQSNAAASLSALSLPANLTPQQQGQLQQILQEVQSGAITPAQAQAEISAIVSAQSQQTSQSGSQASSTQHHHGHHHQSQTLASALNLTTDQQSQIASIIQSAQKNGDSSSNVLSQIENVLTPTQQQQLAQLLSPTYSSTGNYASGSQPPLVSTTA